MNFFERILAALEGRMNTPAAYGWFHLLFIGLVIASVVLAGLFLRRTTDKQNRIVLLVYSGVCLLLELYKQLIYSYNPESDTWAYQWYAFPFQFCSVPMYAALIAGLIKKGRVQNALYSFLSSFGMLAGILVMIIPGDVFTHDTGINIQTMIHHGSQVFIGFYLLMSGKCRPSLKAMAGAAATFIACEALALGMDEFFYHVVPIDATFNMFFISPHIPCHIIVLSEIYLAVPYPVFLLAYTFAFCLGAGAVLGAAKLAALIANRFSKQSMSDWAVP